MEGREGGGRQKESRSHNRWERGKTGIMEAFKRSHEDGGFEEHLEEGKGGGGREEGEMKEVQVVKGRRMYQEGVKENRYANTQGKEGDRMERSTRKE